MIKPPNPATRSVEAVVVDVMPATGLAFAEDANGTSWGLTRATGSDRVEPGHQVVLHIADYGDFAIASGFTPLSD